MPYFEFIAERRESVVKPKTSSFTYIKSEKPAVYPIVLVSIVVARQGDKFCATDEEGGWYLPAGRCNSLKGESFATCAKKHCMLEAALEVKLDGLLRIEFTPEEGNVRIRCIFAASPKDPEAPLKLLPDSDSFGAQWLSTSEMASKSLRHKEALHILKWAESGTEVFPLELLHSTEGITKIKDATKLKTPKEEEIEAFVSQLKCRVKVVFMSMNKPPMYFMDYDGSLPMLLYDDPGTHLEQTARDVLQGFAGELLGEQPELDGVVEVSHVTNDEFTVTYLAKFEARGKGEETTSGNWSWASLCRAREAGVHEDTIRLLEKAEAGKLYPLGVICNERSTYRPLTCHVPSPTPSKPRRIPKPPL